MPDYVSEMNEAFLVHENLRLKKIAAIICKFIEKSNNMLDLCL